MPRPEALPRRAALAVVGLLLLGCGTTTQEQQPAAAPAASARSGTATTPGAPSSEPSKPARPQRLVIGALGLDEPLVGLGLTGTGALEVPEDPDRVGWFTGGGRPGGPGPVVLVGHVDSTTGPAVFARLPELAPGDDVVVGAGGREHRYRVSEVADVPQDPFPTEAVFGATSDDVLRLITCTGPYDREVGRYTENRVVTAERVG